MKLNDFHGKQRDVLTMFLQLNYQFIEERQNGDILVEKDWQGKKLIRTLIHPTGKTEFDRSMEAHHV